MVLLCSLVYTVLKTLIQINLYQKRFLIQHSLASSSGVPLSKYKNKSCMSWHAPSGAEVASGGGRCGTPALALRREGESLATPYRYCDCSILDIISTIEIMTDLKTFLLITLEESGLRKKLFQSI